MQFPESKSISWSQVIQGADWIMEGYDLIAQDMSDMDYRKLELVECITAPGQEAVRTLTLTEGQIRALIPAAVAWLKAHGLDL